MHKVVIILPTYNEKGNIERLIKILEDEVFPKIKNHDPQILVADDSSPDGTEDVVKELMKKYKNLHLNTGEKLGLGAAYLRAMQYAIDKLDADILFQMDADLFHDPHKVPQFLEKIDSGYDMVVGTRYSKGGSIPKNWGIHRRLFSIAGNTIVRLTFMRFWLHDWTGGFRALKKEVFLKEKEGLKDFAGYTFQVAFLHKAVADKFKITEVPFHAKDRDTGRSKIAPAEYIYNLLRYVFKARALELMHSPFLKYAITGFLGYLINATTLELFAGVFHFHPFVAAFLSAELSIIWNFMMNNFWAFKHQRITKPSKLLSKFLQFNLVSFGSLIIISTTVFIATHLFGNTTLVRQTSLVIAIVFFVIPYSYSMYNIFIWKRWHISSLSKLQEKLG